MEDSSLTASAVPQPEIAVSSLPAVIATPVSLPKLMMESSETPSSSTESWSAKSSSLTTGLSAPSAVSAVENSSSDLLSQASSLPSSTGSSTAAQPSLAAGKLSTVVSTSRTLSSQSGAQSVAGLTNEENTSLGQAGWSSSSRQDSAVASAVETVSASRAQSSVLPESHLIASAKACDALLAVKIPETGAKLRRIMNLAQLVQSHALSFFHLSSPDMLLGMDADPAIRNIVGVIQTHPTLGLDGIRLRKFGQQIIERLGGKRIHPAWIVPGGVNEPLSEEVRDAILKDIPEAMAIARRTLDWFKGTLSGFQEEIDTFANFPSMYMGLANADGSLEHYDGWLKMVGAGGTAVADHLDPARFSEYIGESVESFSYLKSTYYKPMGYPAGMYRVGPLARLNLAQKAGTLLADREFLEFRELRRPVVQSSFHYHYARLVETLFGIERIEELLNDPEILSTHVRAIARPNALEGVGVAEAPRGTLMHQYKIDENGLMLSANLIIATGHNNMAMNRGIQQVAKHYINGSEVTEGMLNRVEAVIRTYDPCLSCSTHALGQMPLDIRIVAADGSVVSQIRRD